MIKFDLFSVDGESDVIIAFNEIFIFAVILLVYYGKLVIMLSCIPYF